MLRAWPARATRCAYGARACRPSTGCTSRGPLRLEHEASSSFRGSSRRVPWAESRNSAHKRQPNRELGAATVHVRGADRTAVRLGDRLRDRKAEAGPVALGVLATVETLEQARLRALRQP